MPTFEPRAFDFFARWGSLAIAAAVFFLVVSNGHAAATLPADVTVVDERCVDGNVTALTLSVDYYGEEPATVTPHVWDARQHVQFAWQPTSIEVGPGSQTVTITAPDERGYIDADRAQVYLSDGQQRAITNWELEPCT